MASGVETAETSEAHFIENEDGSLSYRSASNTAGYAISDDGKSVIYRAASDESDVFTITGIGSTAGITVNGNVVTISPSSLNGEDISISGGNFTLALASDVEQPSCTEGTWTSDGTGMTYESASNSAGYKLSSDGKTIIRVEEEATISYTVDGIIDTVGVTIGSDGWAFDSNVFDTTTEVHFTGIAAGTHYSIDGVEYTWTDIDGNPQDVEFNRRSQLDQTTFVFDNEVTVSGIDANDATAISDKIKIVDGVLNFTDSEVMDDYNIHVKYADDSNAVSVGGAELQLIDGDFDPDNGLEIAHTPQTLKGITFIDGKLNFDDGKHTINPAENNELYGFSTVDGGVVIGSTVDGVSISVGGGSLMLFDGDSIAGRLNDGDVWEDGSIIVDENALNAWTYDGTVLRVSSSGIEITGVTPNTDTTILMSNGN